MDISGADRQIKTSIFSDGTVNLVARQQRKSPNCPGAMPSVILNELEKGELYDGTVNND